MKDDEHNAVRIGSEIALYCDQTKGFMFAAQSSASHNNVAVSVNQNVRNPAVGYPDTIVFRVCAQNRYKAMKAYTKMKNKATLVNEAQAGYNAELANYEKAALEETRVNKAEQRRLRGKLLVYGTIVELRHVYTGKYLHINVGRTALLDQNHLRFELMPKNGKSCQFKIIPRFKVKAVGEPVRIDDLVAVESIKVPGQFLHVSTDRFDWKHAYESSYELNLSVLPTGFNVCYARSAEQIEKKNSIKGCDYIQLFHRQKEGYLTAEGVFPNVTESVHFRVRSQDVNDKDHKTDDPSNATTRWRITKELCIYNADALHWDDRIRFHHLTTRQYLMINPEDKTIGLTPDIYDQRNLFAIYPAVGKKEEPILNKTFIRVQHVQTGYWLSATNEEYQRIEVNDISANPESLTANLAYSSCRLKKVQTAEHMNFDDAFSFIQTPVEIWLQMNQASGYIPFLQKLLDDLEQGVQFTEKESVDISLTLKELRKWMLDDDDDPIKLCQTFLRDFKAVDLIISILKLHIDSPVQQKFIQSIRNQCYAFLHVYLQGKSQKNKLHVARNYDFFTDQLFLGGEDSLNAAFLLMELLRNNQFLIDLVTEEQIDKVINLIRVDKNYRYLELLEALCVVKNVGVHEKQNIVLQKWLIDPLTRKQEHVVYHLSSGHEIGLQPGTMYISHDNRSNWMPLGDFCKVSDSNSNLYMFLEYQLRLYGSLCKGRNQPAITAIIEDFGLLTIEFCYLCLADENVSSSLKARICSDISDMFLDVPGNTSMIDHEQLVFQYDLVGKKKKTDEEGDRNLLSTTFNMVPISFMKELKVWIAEYFQSHTGIVASNTSDNRLLEEVLIVVYNLGDFGYYDISDIVDLLDPILKIIDGTNGLPFPNASPEAIAEYRNETRYERHHINDAVVEAKFRACQVVELVFNMRANTRLLHMIELFKLMLENRDEVDLAQYLDTKTDYRNEIDVHWSAINLCQDLFKPTDFFKEKFVDLLSDLRHYKYPHLVTQALTLLHRYHSSHETLFGRMAKTKLVVSSDSIFTLKKIESELPALKEIKFSKINSEVSNHLTDILYDLSKLCVLDNTHDPHRFNQDLIKNYDIINDCIDMITNYANYVQKDPKLANSVLKSLLRFLRIVSSHNDNIQNMIVERLNYLFKLQLPELEFGELLLDMYRDNSELCLQVDPDTIAIVAKLYSKNYHPIWLAFLTCLVDYDGYAIRKNQDFIIKYVLHNEVSMTVVTETTHEERLNILAAYETDTSSFTLKHRLCSLVGLLATCAQGGYRAAESFGQSVLHMDDVLDYLTADELCAGLLSPFAQFLTWSYMNSNSQTAIKDINQFCNDNRLEAFIWRIVSLLDDGEHILSEDRQLGTELLRNRPSNIHVSFDDAKHEKKEILHCVCDAAVPFIFTLLKHHFGKRIVLSHDLAANLARSLSGWAHEAAFCLIRKSQRIVLVNTLRLYSLVGGFHVVIPDLEQDIPESLKTPAQLGYEETNREELLINDTFMTLFRNLETAYEGRNTVRFQIGASNDMEYTALNRVDRIPLGVDFQNLVNSFLVRQDQRQSEYSSGNSSSGTKRLYHVPGIIVHLKNSFEVLNTHGTQLSETERSKLLELDTRLLQVLRGMVHNEWVRITKMQRQKKSSRKQAMINLTATKEDLATQGILEAVLPHFGRPPSIAVVQQIVFFAKEFFEGNQRSSKAFTSFLKFMKKDEFITLKVTYGYTSFVHKEYTNLNRQAHSLELETRNLRRATEDFSKQHSNIWSIKESDEKHHSKAARNKAKEDQESMLELRSEVASQIKAGTKVEMLHTNKVGDMVLKQIYFNGVTSMLLDLVQSLAQNPECRERLRDQPGHALSVNMVQVVAGFLKMVVRDINVMTIRIIASAFRTLGELVKGNSKNQAVAFESKIPDVLNSIIHDADFKRCHPLDAAECLKSAAYLIVFLTEDSKVNTEKTEGSSADSKIIMMALDREAIWSRAYYCYKHGSGSLGIHISTVFQHRHHTDDMGDLKPEEEKAFLDTGFVFFHILKRAVDLNLYDVELHWDDPVWKFFDAETMSVEYVKEGILQRYYFRVKDQNILRKEAEEKLNWEIDRSSSGNKYRDYIGWARDIIDDIRYQRDVNANIIGRLLVHNWKLLNYIVLFLSASIQLIMLILWDKGNDTVPALVPSHLANVNFYLMNVVGVVLNLAAFSLFFSFFLSNLSGFASWANRNRQIIMRTIKRDKLARIQRASKLEVGILSGQTLYYMMFIIMSILGSALSPAFFAFLLLQVTANNQLLGRVISAVTKNGLSLLLVTVMGLILIYIHALIGFLCLRQYFLLNNLFCDTLWQCYLTLLRESLLFTLKRVDDPIVYKTDSDFTSYVLKFLWDMSFYIIVLIISMNVIFGVIVDTFRQLRDSQWRIEQEMQTRCFLCERDNYEFEQRGVRFVNHIRHEHNIMSYVFLLVHMDDSEAVELSAAELYIESLIEEENFTFFPHKKAISLDGFSAVESSNNESETKSELRKAASGLAQLVNEASIKRARMAAAAAREKDDDARRPQSQPPKMVPHPPRPTPPKLPEPNENSISNPTNPTHQSSYGSDSINPIPPPSGPIPLAYPPSAQQIRPITTRVVPMSQTPFLSLDQPVQSPLGLTGATTTYSPPPLTLADVTLANGGSSGETPGGYEMEPTQGNRRFRDAIYDSQPPIPFPGLHEPRRESLSLRKQT